MAMDDFGEEEYYRTAETIVEDFTGRRNAIIKALTEDDDICKFRNMCEQYDIPENEYLGLYGLPDGTWKVMPTSEVPLYLPHSKLYKLPNSEEDQNQWLARVAEDSDTWLCTVFFTFCSISGYYKERREWLFDKINEMPTIYEVVTNNYKNQEVATEKAKKRVEDKSTVSGHCKAFSNSEVVQVKDLKREVKKAITKREPPMGSAIETRSKARRIQTGAQIGKSQFKKIS